MAGQREAVIHGEDLQLGGGAGGGRVQAQAVLDGGGGVEVGGGLVGALVAVVHAGLVLEVAAGARVAGLQPLENGACGIGVDVADICNPDRVRGAAGGAVRGAVPGGAGAARQGPVSGRAGHAAAAGVAGLVVAGGAGAAAAANQGSVLCWCDQ